MTYLIYGVFFQNEALVDPSHQPKEGSAITSAGELSGFPFIGIIHSFSAGSFQGKMVDCFGRSTLRRIDISSEGLIFQKDYDKERRPDPIAYVFQRPEKGLLWSGQYMGPRVGAASAVCVIAQVEESYGTKKFGKIFEEGSFHPHQGRDSGSPN